MRITTLIWKPQFVEKLWRKHKVRTSEVEQVFASRPRIQFAQRGDVAGEDLYRALGKTDAGRYLVVFFIYKGRGRALPISARDMARKEKRSYGKK